MHSTLSVAEVCSSAIACMRLGAALCNHHSRVAHASALALKLAYTLGLPEQTIPHSHGHAILCSPWFHRHHTTEQHIVESLTYLPKALRAACRAKKAGLSSCNCSMPSGFPGGSGGTGHQCTAPKRMSSSTKACRHRTEAVGCDLLTVVDDICASIAQS